MLIDEFAYLHVQAGESLLHGGVVCRVWWGVDVGCDDEVMRPLVYIIELVPERSINSHASQIVTLQLFVIYDWRLCESQCRRWYLHQSNKYRPTGLSCCNHEYADCHARYANQNSCNAMPIPKIIHVHSLSSASRRS